MNDFGIADTSPPTAAPRTAVLALAVMAGALALHMFLPALPDLQREFGLRLDQVQVAVSLPMLAFAPALLIYGPASDRLGRRTVLLAGMVLFTAGGAIAALADGFTALVAGRVVQAIGAASGLVVARALVTDLVAPLDVAGALARIMMVVVLAPMLAGVIGGLTASLFGWRAIAWFLTAFGVVVTCLLAARLGHSEPAPRTGDGRSSIAILSDRRFLSNVAVGASSIGAFFVFVATAPHLVIGRLGRSPTEYGFWFALIAASYIAGNYVTSRLGKRLSDGMLTRVGTSVGVVSAGGLLVAAAAGISQPWQLFAPMVGYTFSSGLTAPGSQAGALRSAAGRAGLASSVFGFIQQSAGAVLVQVAGVLEARNDFAAVPLIAALACAAWISAWWLAPRP